LSKLSVNEVARRSIRGGFFAAGSALLLAACGASTPRQSSVEQPTTVTPEPAVAAAAPAAAAPSAKELRAEKSRAKEPRAKEPRTKEPTRVAASADSSRRRDRRGEPEPAEDGAAAVEAVPEVAAVAYERALAAMRAEDWLTAQVELEQLTAEYPAYPGPYVNLAIVLMHDGHLDEARKALDGALAIDPGHAAANTQLGILLREQGKFEDAEQAYRRALATDPSHALAHYNLAVLLDIYLRRPADAVEHYEAYQGSLAEPDENVARWIIDLRRRAGMGDAARVAQGANE
jgi:lipoprotein NlpI